MARSPDMFASPPEPTADKVLLPPAKAAPLLSVSERTLWQWTKDNRVPHLRMGGKVLYSPEALRAWAAEQSAASVKQTA